MGDKMLKWFCISLVVCGGAWSQTFVRNPFLQMGAPHSASVCWRVDSAAKLTIKYGKTMSAMDSSATQGSAATDGCVTIDRLQPDTKYFYEVYNGASKLSGGAGNYWVTHPVPGTKRKSTFWIIGDAGTGDTNQTAARDAFYKVHGGDRADGFIMLGDNAYQNGVDREFTEKVFEIYPKTMANTFTWPAIGNHENYSGGSAYLAAFHLPTEGQSGGVASKSELYYSFDFANIHFICLDSEKSGRAKTDPMYKWVEQDLQATRQDWIIVFWHHPAYTWGTHNSDTEQQLIDMRVTFLPLLEKYGVDLTYTGHSHNYERSFLLNGAHGSAADNLAQTPTVVLDAKSGNPDTDGPYKKKSATGGGEGAVHTVAGSSGKIGGVKGKHPMMWVQHVLVGTVLLTVDDNVATANFIDKTGAIKDHFQIVQAKTPIVTRNRNSGGKRVMASFRRTGRRLRFSGESAAPFKIYGMDGELLWQEDSAGDFELPSELLPAGEYFYRFGAAHGRMVLP